LLSLRTWLRGPLPGVWADVGASPEDGEDQSFVAEDLDRSQGRVTAYVVISQEAVLAAPLFGVVTFAGDGCLPVLVGGHRVQD
jgi:hypothetical protein